MYKCHICRKGFTEKDIEDIVKTKDTYGTCGRASCIRKQKKREIKWTRENNKALKADLSDAKRKRVEHQAAKQDLKLKAYHKIKDARNFITTLFMQAINENSPDKFKVCLNKLTNLATVVKVSNPGGRGSNYFDLWDLTGKLVKEFEKVYPTQTGYINPEFRKCLSAIVDKPFMPIINPSFKEIHLYISKHNPFRKWLPESLDGFNLTFHED